MDYYIRRAVNSAVKPMRRNFCQACSFARDGVKTRIAIPHTCGDRSRQEPVKHQYIPKREELDKYLERLKELMEPGDPDKNVSLADSNNAELQAKKLSNENSPD
jgi:hypothetical protein